MKRNIRLFIFIFLIFPCYVFANEEGVSFAEGIKGLAWYYVNSFLFFSILVYFLRTPIKQAFSQRKDTIKDDIESSKKLFEDTKKEYETIREKLANIEKEREKIRNNIIDEANRQADEIIQNATKRAASLQEGATLMIQSEEKKALTSLSLQFSNILIEEAKKEIKSSLNDDLEDKLIDRGLERIQEVVNG